MNELQKALTAMVKAYIEEYWEEGAFERTYLQARTGSVPAEYVDFKDEFYDVVYDELHALFRAIADMVEKEAGMEFVSVAVEVNCEDASRVVLYGHYKGQRDVLLLVVWQKAWCLWWNSPEEMGCDLENWYHQALRAARRARTRYAFAVSEEDVVLTAQGMGVRLTPAQLDWVMEHLTIPDWQGCVEEYIRLALEREEL